MTEKSEQRICIKFCYKLEQSCAETIRMMKIAFGDECMGETQIKEWYRRFKGGRTSVVSDPRPGRPSKANKNDNIERVRLAINEDRRITMRELGCNLGIPKTSVWRILNENLQMVRVCEKSGSVYEEKRKEREQKNRAETLVTPDDIEKRKNDEQGLSSDPLDTTENIEKRKNDEQGLSSDPLDTTENIEIPIEEIKIEEIKIEETEILSEDDPGLDYGPSTSINSTLILPGTSSKNNFDFEEKIKSIKKEEVECAEDLPIAPIEFNVAGFSCMQLKPNKRKRSCSSDRAASASLVEDSQNTASDDDALDLTGKIIANKLRRFPKKVRIIAEKLLNDVLYLAELGNLNENSMIVTKHC